MAGAILLAGGFGMLLVWRRKGERNMLGRFVMLLLAGLTFFSMLMVVWPVALVLAVGILAWSIWKYRIRELNFRQVVQGAGYSWSDVEICEQSECLGFCRLKLEFFLFTIEGVFSMKVGKVVGYRFEDAEIGARADYQIVGELMDNFQRGGSGDFRLAIRSDEAVMKSPAFDELEIEEIKSWVEECLTRSEAYDHVL